MALEAAERIVVEQGFEGLSARKVSAAIGYTVGTLYLVFENIDDLVLQVNARTLDRLYARMEKSRTDAPDVRDYLMQLGQVYIRFADEDPHRRRVGQLEPDRHRHEDEHRVQEPDLEATDLHGQENTARSAAPGRLR